MTTQEIINQTKQLIAIPSTAHNPEALHEALDFIAAMIWQACPDVTIERFEHGGKPSLLAYRGDKRPDKFHLVFNGHLDVVPGKPEQYKAVIKDGKLYGRGTYDMKTACVVFTDVFCEFVNDVPFAVGLQIVTDEENAGKDGTLHQIKQGVRADFVICGECGRSTSAREIANEAKGFVIAEIEFHGKAAHSAYPWKGDNAALKATNFINAIHERYPAPTDEDHGTVVSVTSLSALSDAHSKLPDRANVKLVVRYTAEDPHFRSEQHFADFIKSVDPEAKIGAIFEFAAPMYTDPKNSQLLILKESAEKVEGAPFTFVRRHGTGDGRFYGDIGNEACEFGIAGENTHGDNEYVTLEAIKHYHATMRDFLQKAAHSAKARGAEKTFVA